MGFVIVGVVLCALKLAGVGFAVEWSWWTVLSPFGLAAVWWVIADKTGYTSRKSMERFEKRQQARRERSMEATGQRPRRRG